MNYRKLVPPDSFIGKYMDYMSVIETPFAYDFWCALWAIGAGVGREVYVNRPNTPVYLNWYVILAAESGTTRKSTAVGSVLKLFDGRGGGPKSDKQYHVITGNASPKNLKLALYERSHRTGHADAMIVTDELSDMLGREGYMATMPILLRTLYACREHHLEPGTAVSGEIELHNVYISFLSAATPIDIVTTINPTVIEGGFTSRVIFVVEDVRKKSIAWPDVRTDNAGDELTSKFYDTIEAHAEPIGISPGGLKKLTRWYRSRTSHSEPFLSSFESSEDDHVLRCAACLAFNDNPGDILNGPIGTACKIIADATIRR